MAPGVPFGGGGVWTSPALDAARGELYVPVGNPAPDFPAELRSGRNLYTDSIVALDVRTGTLRWYDQLVTPDFHDWDVTQAGPLLTVKDGAKTRDVLVATGKDGLLQTIDRQTHERLHATPVTTRSNTDAPLTRAGVHACPGALGGVEWSGPAFDPGTGLLFTPAVDWCMTFSLSDTVTFVAGQQYPGRRGEARRHLAGLADRGRCRHRRGPLALSLHAPHGRVGCDDSRRSGAHGGNDR